MGQTAKAPRKNRTITVDFQDESTYLELIHNGKAFVEFVLAFILSLGFQLTHKSTCKDGGSLSPGHDLLYTSSDLSRLDFPDTISSFDIVPRAQNAMMYYAM